MPRITKQTLLSFFGIGTVGIARVLNNGAILLVFITFSLLGGASSEDLGSVSILFALLTIISTFTDAGLTEGIQKFLQTHPPKDILFNAIRIEAYILLGTSIISILISLLLGQNMAISLWFGASVLASVYNIIVLVFNGLHKQVWSAIYQLAYVIGFVIVSAICFALLSFSPSLSVLIGITTSWSIMTAAMIFHLYKLDLLTWNVQPLPPEMVSFCKDAALYTLCLLIITQTDPFIIQLTQDQAMVGIFRSLLQLALLMKAAGLAVSIPLLPIAAKMYTEKPKLVTIGTSIAGLVVGVIGILYASIVYLFGANLIGFILPQNDIIEASRSLLPLLIGLTTVQAINLIFVAFLQAIGYMKQVKNTLLIQTILYFVGAYTSASISVWVYVLFLILLECLVLARYMVFIVKKR